MICESQPIRDRPVGGIGDFHTVRGGINPGDMVIYPCSFPGCRSCIHVNGL